MSERALHEWTFPAGCGYSCRIVEIEPGIVQMQQRPLDIEAEAWETVPCAMGAENEMIHLAAEVEDWRESARKAAEEPCGDEKHCACVGPLRRELRSLADALSTQYGIAAKSIARASRAEARIDYLTDALRADHGLSPLPKDQADFRRPPISELEDRHNRKIRDHEPSAESDLRLMVSSLKAQLASVMASRDATSDALLQISREKAQLRTIADEERNQKQRWYEAAGQRQDELNEAHRALAWVSGSLPFDSPNLPEHLRVPEFVQRQVAQAKAQYPTRLSTLDEWWKCPECGPGVASDEDGCCSTCGADLEVIPNPERSE